MITQENIPYTADEIKAMVKTCEKYNKAIDVAKKIYNSEFKPDEAAVLSKYLLLLFPELKEDNNEEKIRKEIVDFITSSNKYGTNERCEAWLNWLEKQKNISDKDKQIRQEIRKIHNAFEECEIVHVEHGKYYYCIKDYYAGGNKRASKGDVVRALNGMNMMALGVKANEYFIPVNNIESNPAWSEEDEEMLTWLCRIIHTQRLDRSITLKEESELGEWIDKWLNHNPHTNQSEQSTDKIKTKFNEGDYIVPYNVTSLEIWKIINIDDDGYYNIQPITDIINTEDNEIYRVPAFALEEDYYLWSINDAHDGDVLVDEDNNIGIYDGEKDDLCWHSCIYLGCDGRLRGFSIGGYHNNKNTKPAAKEQREILFQKMKEAGYEWRQEEKKPIKMKETKFKVRDWIANGGANPCYVKSIFGDYYELCSCEGVEYTKHIIDVNYIYHRWTLADTKDGDVLVNGSNIFIFHFINDTRLMGYCHLNIDNGRFYDDIGKNECFCLIDAEVTPATKEQRDLLFSKMKQEGWEWDAEKKELSKQTLKITPKFCVGQVITDDNGNWYKITNIKCLDDWYYELYDVCENNTHHELCSIIDDKFRENCFVNEIKKMIGD